MVKIFQLELFIMKLQHLPPWKKSPPLSHQPLSKSWGPVKPPPPPPFENLVGGSTPPPSRKGGNTLCYMIHPHLSTEILTLEIHGFKPLLYTCECNNLYKLWGSTRLGIFLILKDMYDHFITKKAPTWIFST